MTSSKSACVPIVLALAAAVITSTMAQADCVRKERTALTPSIAKELCPDYASDPHVKIKHAWVDPETGKGGHCGGKKTEELQLSIANGLFGGNTDTEIRDCTAWCIQNSEGNGHFKFDHKRECFKFRGTGMCGVKKEKHFAKVAKAQLCDETAVVLLDDAKCRNMKGGFTYPTIATLSNDFEVSYTVTMKQQPRDMWNAFLYATSNDKIVHWSNYRPGMPSSPPADSKRCAGEGGVCQCTGTVYYGMNKNWAKKDSTGSIQCRDSVFGDPLPGKKKHCKCASTPLYKMCLSRKLDECETRAFGSEMNVGQQYEFSLHYHNGKIHGYRCSNGADCISRTDIPAPFLFDRIGNGVTDVKFQVAGPNSNYRIKGTLCNVQVRDFGKNNLIRRDAVLSDAGNSYDDIKPVPNEDRHCPGCLE